MTYNNLSARLDFGTENAIDKAIAILDVEVEV